MAVAASPPRMTGRLPAVFPTITIFEFCDLARFSVASIPFHCSSAGLIPSLTIFWKSEIPRASTDLRVASCRSLDLQTAV